MRSRFIFSISTPIRVFYWCHNGPIWAVEFYSLYRQKWKWVLMYECMNTSASSVLGFFVKRVMQGCSCYVTSHLVKGGLVEVLFE